MMFCVRKLTTLKIVTILFIFVLSCKCSQVNNIISTNKANLVTTNALQSINVAEGGRVPFKTDHIHEGREHIVEHNLREHIGNRSINVIKSSNVLEKPILKPVITKTINQTDTKNQNLTSTNFTVLVHPVAKTNDSQKYISVTNSSNNGRVVNSTVIKLNSTTSTKKPTSTTKKPLPTKPLITEHDDGFVVKKTEEHIPKLPDIETYSEKRRRTDYVVPIVAVIFSVPLVAVIISILYKRGTDWWQHRNYRRMDFLIEGMYNN